MEVDDAALEEGRLLFAKECAFLRGVVDMEGLPDDDLPEVAFAGRSNVGKSSLLNALTGRKDLARTSNTPGRTRELNFFTLDNRLRLVDLPGYGYAKASRALVEQWTKLTRDFLRGRPNLRRVSILIDARHGLKKTDEELMGLLDTAAVVYQIVLTKTDKIKPTAVAALADATAEAILKRPAAYPQVFATSSEKGDGLAELRAELAALAA
ncbi:MAG: ribosome biogenesis GTP-binding protein YihA/YsxC [Pseudomonadota bacterium]